MVGANPVDYYKVLGIDRDATTETIKSAYRIKALKYHPDKNKEKDTTALFQKLAEAYFVLIDPQKRAEYDENLDQSSLYIYSFSWWLDFEQFIQRSSIEEINDYIQDNEDILYKIYAFTTRGQRVIKRSPEDIKMQLGDFLEILPCECYTPYIDSLMKRDKQVLEFEDGYGLHFTLALLKDEQQKVTFLECVGSERITILLNGGYNYLFQEKLPGLTSFSPDSSVRKVLEKAFSPTLLLRLASFFDVVPPLAIFLPVVGWAYLAARIVNGAPITTQGYSFLGSPKEPRYTEFGINYHPGGRLTKAYAFHRPKPQPEPEEASIHSALTAQFI